MSRRYVLRDAEILTPDAVRAILAKELLIKASRPVEPPIGNLITARGHGVYYTVFYTEATDSGGQQLHYEDRGIVTMLASEAVLRREWDTPEEDEAWADLLRAR